MANKKSAGKKGNKKNTKQYLCFTTEQQQIFDSMPPKQRAFIEYRAKGLDRTAAYTLAGYNGEKKTQAAYVLEKRPFVKDLIDCLEEQNRIKEVMLAESGVGKDLRAKAVRSETKRALERIEKMSDEAARRVEFYRDIVNGKTKSMKTVLKRDPDGNIIEITQHVMDDTETKMKARKELDRLLGLFQVPSDMESFNMGDITINIVDASKKEDKVIEIQPEATNKPKTNGKKE